MTEQSTDDIERRKEFTVGSHDDCKSVGTEVSNHLYVLHENEDVDEFEVVIRSVGADGEQ